MTGAGDHSLRGLVAGTKYVKNTPHCVAQRSCFLICWDSIERKLQAASSLSQALKFWVATRRRDAHFHHIVQHSLPLQHHEPYSSGTMSAAAKGEPVCHLVYVRFKAHGQVLRLNMYYVTVPICEMYMFSGRYVNAGITRPEISCIVCILSQYFPRVRYGMVLVMRIGVGITGTECTITITSFRPQSYILHTFVPAEGINSTQFLVKHNKTYTYASHIGRHLVDLTY